MVESILFGLFVVAIGCDQVSRLEKKRTLFGVVLWSVAPLVFLARTLSRALHLLSYDGIYVDGTKSQARVGRPKC